MYNIKRIFIKTIICMQLLFIVIISPLGNIAEISNISIAAITPTEAQIEVGNYIAEYTARFIEIANSEDQQSGGYTIYDESMRGRFLDHNQLVVYSSGTGMLQLSRTSLKSRFVSNGELQSGLAYSPGHGNYALISQGLGADCSSFVNTIYKLVCNIEIPSSTWYYPDNIGDVYGQIECVGLYENGIAIPGDIIIKKTNEGSSHAMIFNRVIDGSRNIIEVFDCSTGPTTGLLVRTKTILFKEDMEKYGQKYRVYRIQSSWANDFINPDFSDYIYEKKPEDLNWPGDVSTPGEYEWREEAEIDPSSPDGKYSFYYNGLPKKVSIVQSESLLKKILKFLSDILDWVLGLMVLGIKIQVVGWTGIVEGLLGDIVDRLGDTSATSEGRLNIEKIIYNKVPILDINIFNLKKAGGVELNEDSVIYKLRQAIAGWYYIMFMVAAIGLLITLLYIGLRMAITTIAEEKANYKSMLVNWVISVAILCGLHIFMVAVIYINNTLIELITSSVNMNFIEDALFLDILALSFMKSVPATIAYVAFTFYLVKFLIVYFKRLLDVAILTLMAPVIAIAYSIDKIKDGKSQSLSSWMKGYVMAVGIQLMNALIFTIFMSVVIGVLNNKTSLFMWASKFVLIIVILNFMFSAEKIVKKIFGKTGNNNVGDVAEATLKGMFGYSVAKNIGGWYSKNVIKPALSKLFKPVTRLYNKAGVASMKYSNKYQQLYSEAAKSGDIKRQQQIDEMAKREWEARKEMDKRMYANAFNTAKNVGAALLVLPMAIASPALSGALLLQVAQNYPTGARKKLKKYKNEFDVYKRKTYKRELNRKYKDDNKNEKNSHKYIRDVRKKRLKYEKDKGERRKIKNSIRSLSEREKENKSKRKKQMYEDRRKYAQTLKAQNADKKKKVYALAYIANSYLTLGLTNNAIEAMKKEKKEHSDKYKKGRQILHDVSLAEGNIRVKIDQMASRKSPDEMIDLRDKMREILERNSTEDIIRDVVQQKMRQNRHSLGHSLEPEEVKSLMQELKINPGKNFEQDFKESGAKGVDQITTFIYNKVEQSRSNKKGYKEMSAVLEQTKVLREANNEMKKIFGKSLYNNVDELIDAIFSPK